MLISCPTVVAAAIAVVLLLLVLLVVVVGFASQIKAAIGWAAKTGKFLGHYWGRPSGRFG